MEEFRINKLSFARALALALEAARIYGTRQRVFKHPVNGWTWDAA